MTEINAGMYDASLRESTILPVPYKILYADPTGRFVEGETQKVFADNNQNCSVFVGPAWSSQMLSIGEFASIEKKPLVSGGANSPLLSKSNFEYVTRVIPSDTGLLDAVVALIVEYDLPMINLVYFNDDYGRSIAEELISRSEGLFSIEVLRSFDGDSSDQALEDIMDDLEESWTHVTYVATSRFALKRFLDFAGERGMHRNHLWVSPPITNVLSDLEIPPTGSWGLAYGEQLQGDEPLSRRYVVKDIQPHLAAMEYGLKDDYDVLTYWGAYAYDAVLAAVHGLAAVYKNSSSTRSNGEELLHAIRNISFVGSTGRVNVDERGDRIGARIPLFYVTAQGTSEQFAAYEVGKLEFLSDPLWPGGSQTRPADLIRSEPPEDNHKTLIMAIVFPTAFTIAIVFMVLLFCSRKGVRDNRSAPKIAPCCLLFTDIESSSSLWGAAPAEMSEAIDTHHREIRSCLKIHGAYEVKTIGDSFMIACACPDAALRLAVDLQHRLYHAQWDPAIGLAYEDILQSTQDPQLWRGLRVRVSVHYGNPDIVFDKVTKGYDYYGTVVNEAARIEALAHGGQTVVSEAFKDALKQPPAEADLEDLGEYELRGCPGTTKLWQLVPVQFKMRTFPPLRVGDTSGEDGESDEDIDWAEQNFSTPDDVSSVASSYAANHREQTRVLHTLFSIFKPTKRKDMIDKFCHAWRVSDEEELVMRISKASNAKLRRRGLLTSDIYQKSNPHGSKKLSLVLEDVDGELMDEKEVEEFPDHMGMEEKEK